MATNRADATDQPHPLELLFEYMAADNVADLLTKDQLGNIGRKVVDEYTVDVASRSDWEESNREAMKLALQVKETKTYPWPNAANVKFPLLTTAAMQFAARAYPAIVPGDQPVKAKVNGRDEDGKKRERAERVGEHMSYQLTEQMEEWEEDTDTLLHVLPIAGLAYRKTFYDPVLGRNRSELVMPNRLVVNDGAKDLDTCPRITHELDPVYPNTYEEKVRSGLWRRCELGPAKKGDNDTEAPHDFLEQHRLLDLDEDGLAEPWIVTVHKDTAQVVRIFANFEEEDIHYSDSGEIERFDRQHYFTKYTFLPNPDGGFHTIGFGYLLRPLSEVINTTINQMLDAGTVANMGGGFIGSQARLKAGSWRFRPGEFKHVDVPGGILRDSLVPLQFPGPSVVLFQLLGLLIESAKDITSVKDVLTGEAQGRNASPTTTLALIEQGMQVFSAIYKRIYRSLRREYKKLYRLNARFLEQDAYYRFEDEQKAVAREDYNPDDLDICPVADPRVVTNMQRLGRAQFLMEFRGDPDVNQKEIKRRIMEAAGIEDLEEVIVQQTATDPKVAEAADKMDIEKRKVELDATSKQYEDGLTVAKTLLALAQAEAAEVGPQLEQYKAELGSILDAIKMRHEAEQNAKQIQAQQQQATRMPGANGAGA